MPTILPRGGGSVKAPPDAIDRAPLAGRERNTFESSLYAKVKRSQQLVLRIILDHAGGRADAWPSNGRIAEIAGHERRNVQILLRALEAAGVIRSVVDRSIKTQRRIVLLDHPNAVKVLSRLGDRPWAPGAPPKAVDAGAQKPPSKRAPNMHVGAQSSVGAGAQESAGAGAQGSSSKLSGSGELRGSNSGSLSALRRGLRTFREAPQAPADPEVIAAQKRSQARQVAALEARLAARAGQSPG